MEKHDLYRLVDISEPDDFKYYENVESIMESDDYIEPDLLFELFGEIEWSDLSDLFINYFDELFRVFPEKEDDLCMTIQGIIAKFKEIFNSVGDEESVRDLATEVHNFKKWFVYDKSVTNLNDKEKTSVRDAVYDIYAVRFGGSFSSYNFDNASSYINGYDIKIMDLI